MVRLEVLSKVWERTIQQSRKERRNRRVSLLALEAATLSILLHVVSEQESGRRFVHNERHMRLFVSVITVLGLSQDVTTKS